MFFKNTSTSNFALLTFFISTVAVANITPVTNTTLTNDTYIGYQWALKNQGQSVTHDIDDVHSVEVKSNFLADIGWDPNLDSQFTRDVVVAVVDSGVDPEHEDLKGHFALNEKECVDGKIQTGPTGDPDGNGFEGDCQGWSFVALDKKRARLTDDDIGHGTHIAGIIAATVNNGIGISGLSNRIKILSLKVYDEKEESGSVTKRTSISDRVSQAIDYAVLRKADVINLSLGWPIVNNTDKVKKSIDAALNAGIIIVAGAGNDRHEAQIYPCAHPGVICVGSVDLDGQVSRFSNYGGHVDVLAPGGDILSTWPMLKMSQQFGPKGYEIKSGTSQGTPYVSGAAAILKGIFPQISTSELRARLLFGAQSSSSEAFSLKGLINIKKSVEAPTSQIIIPVFKTLDHITFNRATKTFSLPVTIQNLGDAKNVNVSVNSKNIHVSLNAATQTATLAANSSQTLQFAGTINNVDGSATLPYEVKISGVVFEHQVQLTRNLNNDSAVRTVTINTQENIETLNLSSVRTYGIRNVDPEYWSAEKIDEGLKVRIYRLNSMQLSEAGSFVLPNVSELLADISVLRIDANYDGQMDYLVGGLIRDAEGNAKDLQYSYIGHDLKGLFGDQSHIVLKYENVIPSLKGLRFGQYQSPSLGLIAVPVFFTEGTIPSADQNPDVFAFEQNTSAWRLYYLEPTLDAEKIIFQTRSFFNYRSLKELRKTLGLSAAVDLLIQNSLSQSEADYNKGQVRILSSSGSGIVRQYFILNISSTSLQNQEVEIVKADYQGLDLLKQVIDETLTSDASGESVGSNIVGVFTQTKSRAIVLNRHTGFANIANVLPFNLLDPYERILGLVKTFEVNNESISFYEADTRLNAVGTRNGKSFNVDSPIYRSSFLPGQFFTQRFFPMFVGKDINKTPALYVDNTLLFSPTIAAWTLNERNELIVPLRLSFEVPEGCKAMNPAKFISGYALTLLCRESDHSSLKFIELK